LPRRRPVSGSGGGSLVHRRIQAIQFGEDLVGRFGPDEGPGIVIVLGDVAVGRGLEVDDRVEAAAPTTVNAAARKL
jgi:hypothetical protein